MAAYKILDIIGAAKCDLPRAPRTAGAPLLCQFTMLNVLNSNPRMKIFPHIRYTN